MSKEIFQKITANDPSAVGEIKLKMLKDLNIVYEVKDIKVAVKDLLIKWGNNPKDVEAMIKQEFDGAVKSYPQGSAKTIAEYIRTNF